MLATQSSAQGPNGPLEVGWDHGLSQRLHSISAPPLCVVHRLLESVGHRFRCIHVAGYEAGFVGNSMGVQAVVDGSVDPRLGKDLTLTVGMMVSTSIAM